jgi:xylulokinase
LLEGVGFSIRHNLEAMKDEGMEIKRILAVGGGALNLPWMQMVSDISGIAQMIPEPQAGAPYGDAFLAGVGAGLFASSAEAARWVKPGRTFQPDTAAFAAYEPLYRIYRDLYTANQPLMSRLTTIQRARGDYT